MAGRKNNYVTKEEFDAYTVKTDANFAKLFQLLEAPKQTKASAPQTKVTELPKQTKGKGVFDRACYRKTAEVLGCNGAKVDCYKFARAVVSAYAKGEATAKATIDAYNKLEKPDFMA